MRVLLCLSTFLWAATTPFASAGSATWSLNPSNGDWYTAANWTPATIPNGDDDVATFGFSPQTSITESQTITLASMIFQPDSASYTIMAGAKGTDENLVFVGEGIINQSASVQHFQLGSLTAELVTAIFQNDAQAGTATEFSVGANQDTLVGEGASPALSGGGGVGFFDDSSAAAATFIVKAAASAYRDNGTVDFYDNASAGNATVILEGAAHTSYSGELAFHDESSPADSTLTAEGASVPGAVTGGTINFLSPFLGQGTIIANTGTNGGRGGGIGIVPGASGTPRVELFGTGNLGFYGSGTVEIGSLEGDGIVGFSGNHLIVGGNNLSTAFAGLIQYEGSLVKTGTGTFTLSGANTYTEGTAITRGTLVVANTIGSATGTGAVNVSSGTLGGAGIIAGATTIGTGKGGGAFLRPATGAKAPVTFTIQNSLTLGSDSTYTCTFKAKKTKSQNDKVIANGVTINSGAQFGFSGQARGQLRQGTSFTVISNTASTPISGTFASLPDGGIITAGGNNLQASYEGGDGNDLTLTVIP